MNKPAHPHRWFTGWRVAARPPQDDPADMGTAFGLDLSMHTPEESAPATASRPPQGWVQRMTSRRKSAA
jgi:hypothetical protein